jgi:osmotically-inducible protein OsmY
MTVAAEPRADQEIQNDVLAELKWDARVKPNEIGVTVTDGIVTLSGWVDSYTKSWAAEESALRVRGVKAVANDIDVRLSPLYERTDGDIADVAVYTLESDAFVHVDELDISVSKGWVTLKGEVEWQYQKEDAEQVVRRLSGVKSVTNLLVLKPQAVPSDIRSQIEHALARSAHVDAQRISVEVEGSRVALKGTVRSWAEREETERQAWLAPGVTSVDNQIDVRY